MLHTAQVNSEIVERARKRQLENQTAQLQADATAAQINASQQQLWLQAQKQMSDNLNAQQDRQVEIFKASVPQRVSITCHTYGNTTNCY